MTDTQDTNLPKLEEGLEDVKQTVEAPEPAAQELTAPKEVVEEAQETLEAAAEDESARKLTKPEILFQGVDFCLRRTFHVFGNLFHLGQNFWFG